MIEKRRLKAVVILIQTVLRFVLSRNIYLFNYNSSKSTIFMLNMAFHVLLSTVFVK